MMKLHHPFLIHCFGTFSEGNTINIIQEYAEGGNLDAFIKSHRDPTDLLSRSEIIRICWELCHGVAYLHSRNVIHRDLKSTNILLTRDLSIKIGDFGSSREVGGENDLMSTHVGTPLYMSPEIILRRPYTKKADIWSLGCLLYLICTQRHPFQSTDFLNLYFSVES